MKNPEHYSRLQRANSEYQEEARELAEINDSDPEAMREAILEFFPTVLDHLREMLKSPQIHIKQWAIKQVLEYGIGKPALKRESKLEINSNAGAAVIILPQEQGTKTPKLIEAKEIKSNKKK